MPTRAASILFRSSNILHVVMSRSDNADQRCGSFHQFHQKPVERIFMAGIVPLTDRRHRVRPTQARQAVPTVSGRSAPRRADWVQSEVPVSHR